MTGHQLLNSSENRRDASISGDFLVGLKLAFLVPRVRLQRTLPLFSE